MLPTSTVENYLKTIFRCQAEVPEGLALVPMGQLAAALGVVPGTATTMVKTLAEAGLVAYEPYSGVRLSTAGEKLAALVLRRHRLVELFLVQVMGMSWTEVHDEAEKLEHVVSERLIERIDDMLGRPVVDPHGDPIPDSEGTLARRKYHSLLTCPLNTKVAITRVMDQDAAFLKFIERSSLMPGQTIEVEARDAAADSVLVRAPDERRVALGTRAASKLLVEVVQALLLVLALGAGAARAQSTQPSPPPFEILDNSFLVEEAFNQEAGIFQNIVGALRARSGDWGLTFTQEWPVGTQKHQFSYTVPFAAMNGSRGIGDILINYRFQAFEEGAGRPACAPRLSVILPSGSTATGLGDGVVGWQVNLPLSKQAGDVYWHWNAGFTWLPSVEPDDSAGPGVHLVSPHVAASLIWRARPMLNVLVEAVAGFEETPALSGTARETTVTVSPGIRGGWNFGDRQLILGLAVPVSWTASATDAGVFGYLSYELPFARP